MPNRCLLKKKKEMEEYLTFESIKNRLSFEPKDADNEVPLLVENERGDFYFYFSKQDAIEIINHLKKYF